MFDRLLYRFRYLPIIIAIIGVWITLYIVVGGFDSLNASLDYSLNWLRPIIEIIIWVSWGLGITYWYDKKWGSAIEDYNLGVQFLLEEIKKNEAKFIEIIEKEIIDTEKMDKALLLFENAINKNPYLWQAYFNATIIYYLRKNYNKALEYIKTAIKLKPKFGRGYLLLGAVLYVKEIEVIEQRIETQDQSDLYKEAIEAYKKALKLRLSKENKLCVHA